MKSSLAQKEALLAALKKPATAVPCPDCAEYGARTLVEPDQYESMRLPMLDENGAPAYDREGKPRFTTVRMKKHVLPRSTFDPVGLAPASCPHGAARPDHIDPKTLLGRTGVSWIRSKYLDTKGQCPVCRGEPQPDDMMTPRVATA